MEEKVLSRFWSKVDKTGDCWLWLGATGRGYGQVRIHGIRYRAHRVAWELSNGPVPVGLVVMHKCDVRNCVNPDHLQVGTQSENMLDAFRKGRLAYPRWAGSRASGPRASGDSHYNVKIPDSEIPVIRARAAAGDSLAAIARDYQVTGSNISQIVKYQTRNSVKIKDTEASEKLDCGNSAREP